MRGTGHGAEAEFDAYVHARVGALSRTAFLLTGDHQLAEDLVQTTLFKAAKAWHRIEGDPDPYVRRVMANENISGWRRRRHVRELPLEAYGAEPASPQSDPDLRLVLKTALAQLTPKQRTVLVLRYFEDLTEAQTAEVMGVGVGTVKSGSRAALGRLRDLAPHLADLVTVGREER
jgi:RNA polymerase sigma-70 factor (sigma-E family)